ncbi:hypothetical protein [Coraliomargarita parva]|uniref:hypothetical protein n=1 Tax=Coraliomargarita parva TaxID=3014050 RepID=UPI0022B419E9|nr:hypothetical protein [Coraliomargarita parva]
MLNNERMVLHNLERAGAKLRRLEAYCLGLRITPLYALLVCLFLLLDLIFRFGPSTRLAMLLAAIGLGFVLACWGLWYGGIRKVNSRRIARHLETSDPTLGSSLINFLDLQATTSDEDTRETTRMLAQRALESHAGTASRHELVRTVKLPQLSKRFERFAYVSLAGVAACILAWPVVKAQLPRLLDPYGDHPPFSLTALRIEFPGEDAAPVVYGQSLKVQVGVKGHNPGQVNLIYWPSERPEEVYQISMLDRGKDGYVQQIPEVTEALTLVAETATGRARTKERQVQVHLTPQLLETEVIVTPPAYTKLPALRRPYRFTELKALAGSSIEIIAHSNRPLAGGSLTLSRPLDSSSEKTIQMRPGKEHEAIAQFTAEASIGFNFKITDEDGLDSDTSPKGSLFLLTDRPPAVNVTQPEQSAFLALDASLNVQIEAYDDYGLQELRVHRAINGIFSPPQTITADSGKQRNLKHTWELDFSQVGVQAGDVVTVYAEVIDNAPEPQMSRSGLVQIAAITVADYNNMLRREADMARIARKYESIRAEFENLMSEQAAIREALSSLQKQLEGAKTDAERDAIMEQFKQLQARQEALNSNLDQLAKSLNEAIRDQPLYDVERNFQEQFKRESEKLYDAAARNRYAGQQISKQMQEAAGMSPEEQAQALQAFAEALQRQQEALGAGQESTEAASQTMQDMARFHEMVKNFNRFAALAGEQAQLAGKVAAYDRGERLSRADQLALRDLAAEQERISQEIQLLAEKMREDAEAGAENFPKAAQSSRDFADAMEQVRLPQLSKQSTQSMLAGSGPKSAALSQATAEAMQSLLSQCNGSMGEMSQELDRALSAQRPNGGAGNTFEQMLENMQMRYSIPSSMLGQSGSGQRGSGLASGYSVSSPQGPELHGNESLAADGQSTASQNSQGGGIGNGSSDSVISHTYEDPEALTGMQETERRSSSAQSESLFMEKDQIIDAYFKKITEENQ